MKAGVIKNVVLLVVTISCFALTAAIYQRNQVGNAPSLAPPPVSAQSPARQKTASVPTSDGERSRGEGSPSRPMAKNVGEAFDRAVEAGDSGTLKVLLAEGGRPSSSRDHWPPLVVAAGEGHVTVLRVLIEAGADVNRAGAAGWTPLMMAGANDQAEAVRMLLDARANPLRENELGQTFFEVVRKRGAERVRSLLEEPAYRGLDSRLFIRAVCRGDVEAVTRMLGEGTPVDSKDAAGLTALHVLLKGGRGVGLADGESRFDPQMVRLLLDRGADLEAREAGTERTPLMDALFGHVYGYDNVPIVTLLLDRGASLEARDNKGRTPIELVITIQDPEQKEALTAVLLARNASGQ